jgi:hypothetical protein
MAGRGSSKWHTERARREKAAAKRERRDQRAAGVPADDASTETETSTEPAPAPASQAEVLDALAALHEAYADGGLTLEQFETTKEGLIEQLQVE